MSSVLGVPSSTIVLFHLARAAGKPRLPKPILPERRAGTPAAEAEAVLSQLKQRIVRPMYSSPPLHGARIAAGILGDAELRAAWLSELRDVADRIKQLRTSLAAELRALHDELAVAASDNVSLADALERQRRQEREAQSALTNALSPDKRPPQDEDLAVFAQRVAEALRRAKDELAAQRSAGEDLAQARRLSEEASQALRTHKAQSQVQLDDLKRDCDERLQRAANMSQQAAQAFRGAVDDGRVRGAVDRWGVRWIAGGRWIRCERGEAESVRWGVDDVRVRRFAEFGSERRFVRRRRRRGWVRCFRDAVCVRGTVHDGWIRSEFGHTGRIRIERAGGESVWGFDGDAGRLWGERADGRVRRRTDTGCVRCRANT